MQALQKTWNSSPRPFPGAREFGSGFIAPKARFEVPELCKERAAEYSISTSERGTTIEGPKKWETEQISSYVSLVQGMVAEGQCKGALSQDSISQTSNANVKMALERSAWSLVAALLSFPTLLFCGCDSNCITVVGMAPVVMVVVACCGWLWLSWLRWLWLSLLVWSLGRFKQRSTWGNSRHL